MKNKKLFTKKELTTILEKADALACCIDVITLLQRSFSDEACTIRKVPSISPPLTSFSLSKTSQRSSSFQGGWPLWLSLQFADPEHLGQVPEIPWGGTGLKILFKTNLNGHWNKHFKTFQRPFSFKSFATMLNSQIPPSKLHKQNTAFEDSKSLFNHTHSILRSYHLWIYYKETSFFHFSRSPFFYA